MPLVIVARLRVRHPQFMPEFGMHAMQSVAQVRQAKGCLRAAFLEDQNLTFWNATIWESENAMLEFVRSGAHRAAMPNLARVCDQAIMLRFEQPDNNLPTWLDLHARLKPEGRASKLDEPAPEHFLREFPVPNGKEML
jgi:quinol monooxygenase YgiN